MHKKCLRVIALLSFVFMPAVTQAQEGKKGPRHLLVGLTTIKEHGFGVMLRGRANRVAVEAAVGYNPVLMVLQTEDGSTDDIQAAMALHAGGHFLIYFTKSPYRKFQNGLKLGGIWDKVLGPGGMIGWVGDLTWTNFNIAFGAGFQIYPDAEAGIKKEFNPPSNAELSPLTTVQPYLGVNFGWYIL